MTLGELFNGTYVGGYKEVICWEDQSWPMTYLEGYEINILEYKDREVLHIEPKIFAGEPCLTIILDIPKGKEILFENDVIRVSSGLGKEHDFMAVIENKTDKDMGIIFDDEVNALNFSIDSNGWIGLLVNDKDCLRLEKIKVGQFTVDFE